LPSLFGVAGGGHNFFDRAIRLAGQLGDINWLVLLIGAGCDPAPAARRALPARPVGLTVMMALLIVLLRCKSRATRNANEGPRRDSPNRVALRSTPARLVSWPWPSPIRPDRLRLLLHREV
jgi:hypothetical protein